MSAAIYSPLNIPITDGTLSLRPDSTGSDGKILIQVVTQAGVQALFIDASWLGILQDEICRLQAATGLVAVG